ncbi:MAG: BMP family protein [Gaiellaceae bacterium]
MKARLVIAAALCSVLVLALLAALAQTGAGARAATAKTFKVGLVTDVGGLHDRGFNQLSYAGLKRAQAKLHVQGRVLLSKSNSDYIPNLSALARQGYDLVIAVGFLMTDAVDTVATQFPNTKFAIIDVDQKSLKHKPKNVEGLIFREQEGGYLIGYLAGLVAKHQGGKQIVGVVGGISIPPVNRFAGGYKAGAKAADPGVKVLVDYSQDFVVQAKCKERALNQIAAGAQVIFADAGACGLGVLDAAKEKGIWALGGDADQSYLGPQVLSSELKKVDVSVYSTIDTLVHNRFKGNGDAVFTTANGGIGIGKISPKVPKSIVNQVLAVKKKMAAGTIKNIPTAP